MADDANRDEVHKCKIIAESAIAAGDPEKATRFLMKAKRMSPNDAGIDQLLAKAASCGGASPAAGHAGGDARPRARAAPAGKPAAPATAEATNYTPDQVQQVRRILRVKDYYDILEVPRDAGEDSIKKAYKKLALKLHPDKNKAPGAEEAFKKLSKAVQCLTDSNKKEVYDRYGDEEPRVRQHQHHHQGDFVHAEDIFSMFFGAHPGQHHQQDAQAQQRAGLTQMFPILILVLITALSNFASSNSGSKFAFTQSDTFRNERSTASLDVPYFVADDFAEYYPEGTHNLGNFERQVEIHYVRTLHSECDYQEKTMYKKVMIARRKNSQEEMAAARRHPRPACKEIDHIKKSHGDIFRAAMYMGY